VVEELLGT